MTVLQKRIEIIDNLFDSIKYDYDDLEKIYDNIKNYLLKKGII